MREVKVGQVWRWNFKDGEEGNFAITHISAQEASYKYLSSDFTATAPLDYFDSDAVLVKDVKESVEEEEEEKLREVMVGQKYRRAGDWQVAEPGSIVEVESVEATEWGVLVGLLGGPIREAGSYFFQTPHDFYKSNRYVGYVLVEEAEEAPETENNQLSPNVYQFPNGVEVKDISAHLTSFGGQAVQYIARATRLDGVVKGLPIQDLYKAIELLKWEAERMEALQK